MSEAKFTPAPWRWEVNKKHRSVTLCGGKPKFDNDVLRFKRYGMQGAQPTFSDGIMQGLKATDLAVEAKDREHHSDWFMLIKHPDAQLIEAAPDMYNELQNLLNTFNHESKSVTILDVIRIEKLLAKARGES